MTSLEVVIYERKEAARDLLNMLTLGLENGACKRPTYYAARDGKRRVEVRAAIQTELAVTGGSQESSDRVAAATGLVTEEANYAALCETLIDMLQCVDGFALEIEAIFRKRRRAVTSKTKDEVWETLERHLVGPHNWDKPVELWDDFSNEPRPVRPPSARPKSSAKPRARKKSARRKSGDE